jgi:glycosyltransferase involved in cell wall biosynthesis
VPGARPVVGIDASRAFQAGATGTENYSHHVIGGLVARDRFAYRLYARSTAVQQPAGAELRVFGPPRLWTHVGLAAELARRPPDLLFVPAHVLPLWPRPPSVVTVHDLGYLAFPEAHPPAQRWYLDWTTRRHVRHATRLIADSAVTRDDLVRHYGADPERVDVVHLGVDPGLAPAPADAVCALRQRLGLGDATRYLVHVGTLQPRKNLPRLLAAFADVLADRPDIHLVLAGGAGWGGEDLAGRAAALGLADRVHLTGYLARAELAPLYTGAVAAVVPSLYEGFGLTALEAMACGTPVAVSATSSLPEVVGDAALSFDPLDVPEMARTLARLLDDANLRSTLIAAGHARVAKFSWDRCVGETEAVLARALGLTAL